MINPTVWIIQNTNTMIYWSMLLIVPVFVISYIYYHKKYTEMFGDKK